MTRTQVSDPGPINPLLCIADDVGKMASWADSWQGLPDSEKLQYKNRAREFQPECDQKKKGTAMLKKRRENGIIFTQQDITIAAIKRKMIQKFDTVKKIFFKKIDR